MDKGSFETEQETKKKANCEACHIYYIFFHIIGTFIIHDGLMY